MSSRSSSNSYSSPEFSGRYNVGWIKSAHGIRGELFLRLHADRADWADDAEEIFLLLPGKTELQTFEIVSMKPHKDGWILQLDGSADRNYAETLAKSVVYIDSELLDAEPGSQIFLNQILGFEVIDKNGLVLGVIAGFGSNGPQDLLKVKPVKGKEALVPLIDAFLVHIDFDKKQLTMDLPPGLLNLEEE